MTQIDATPPTSSISALPQHETTASFTLNWTASDPNNGSGVAAIAIYDSANGGAFTLWKQESGTARSDTFTGVNGDSYGFYSVATDKAGNVQTIPSVAQASTVVGSSASPSAFDGFESGDFSALPWLLSNVGTVRQLVGRKQHCACRRLRRTIRRDWLSQQQRLELLYLHCPPANSRSGEKRPRPPASGSLIFEIDGVPQLQLSGTMPWQQSFFWVPAGQHTFTWLYGEECRATPAGDDLPISTTCCSRPARRSRWPAHVGQRRVQLQRQRELGHRGPQWRDPHFHHAEFSEYVFRATVATMSPA